MSILVTAFEPFGGDAINASAEALAALPDEIAGHKIEKLILPVSFARAPGVCMAAIKHLKPCAVVSVGQAPRADISIERTAINMATARRPDADGFRPQTTPVSEDGPAAYFTQCDADALVVAIRASGIPAHISDSAGLYVCNTLYYTLLHEFPHLPVLFVHVPLTPTQAVTRPEGTPSMHTLSSAAALTTVCRNVKKYTH